MFRREAEQIGTVRAGEAVDGLARIAHDADIVAIAQPDGEQGVLQRADVLVLVHREEAVALAQLHRRPRLRLQHAGGQDQHVLEVDLAALIQQCAVLLLHGEQLLG